MHTYFLQVTQDKSNIYWIHDTEYKFKNICYGGNIFEIVDHDIITVLSHKINDIGIIILFLYMKIILLVKLSMLLLWFLLLLLLIIISLIIINTFLNSSYTYDIKKLFSSIFNICLFYMFDGLGR